MKSTLSMLLSIMAVATSVAEQMTFSLEPQTPSSSDDVQLTISQEFDSTCYSSTASFERIENTINVEIVSKASGEICLPVISPQSVTVNLGELQAGTYQVNVNWNGAPGRGSRAGTSSFDVTGPGMPPQLEVAIEGDTLSCQLTGLPAGSVGYWILQSSADLNSWEDLLFFDMDGEAVVAIPPGGQERQFLRARHIETDDPVLRDFLSARNTWRSAGIDHYTIEVSLGGAWFFWRGIVTVLDNEIISAAPIETNYPEPPAQRTIDGWFAHLESFLDPRADQVDAIYDPLFGFTSSAYVDIDRRIADEEQSWAILAFQPLP